MWRNALRIVAAVVVVLLVSSLLWNLSLHAVRGQAALKPQKENFDIRDRASKDAVSKFERRLEKFSAKYRERNVYVKLPMRDARTKKFGSVSGLEVQISPVTNSPGLIEARGNGRQFLTLPSLQSRENIVKGFINDNSDVFGLSARQVSQLRKVADYTNPNGQLSWLTLEQRWNGMRVFQGEVQATFTSSGQLARMTGELTREPEAQDLETVPKVSAAQAVVAAAASIDEDLTKDELTVKESSPDGRRVIFNPVAGFTGEIKLELMYFPLDAGLATLAWSMVLWQDGQSETAYYTLVDALEVEVLWRKDLTNHQTQPGTYVVYSSDSPAPLSPTNALPGSGIQGTAVPRTSFTLISEGAFNNLGWLTDGVNTTTGNNVDAGLDLVAPNGIDVGGRPTGSPFRVFDFVYNPAPGIPPPSESPTLANYRFGEVVNMFFWTNRFHDRLYELGFTEAARNFQTVNFTPDGLGNDHVLAEAQDFSGTSNANFLTPPDGTSPRMQMFIFNGPNPDRTGESTRRC